MLPLALPGVVAGSIFTFSLTLGDYITPALVGGGELDFIGNVVYRTLLAARATCPSRPRSRSIPLAVMGAYLLIARRLGAFEAL